MSTTEFHQTCETILEVCYDPHLDPQKESALNAGKIFTYSFVSFFLSFSIAMVISAIFFEFSTLSLLVITLLIGLPILSGIFWYRSKYGFRYITGIIVDSEKEQILEKFWQKDRYCYELIVPTSNLRECKFVHEIDRAIDEDDETVHYYRLHFVSQTVTDELSEQRYSCSKIHDKNGPEIARRINAFLGLLA
jgi:hypothetical protein